MTGLRFPMPLFAASLLVSAALLTGCQHGPGGTIDPFGRTTIPPPPTGAASIHSRGSQYYGSNPKPLVPVAVAKTNATAATPSQGGAQAATWVSNASKTAPPMNPTNRLQPIPPYEAESSSVKPPPGATPPPSAATTRVTAPAATAKASVTPAPAATSIAPKPAAAPSPASAAPVDPTAPLQWSHGKSDPAVQPAVATTPVTGQNVTVRREPVAENPPRKSRYGHSKDYTSLRGQLEYSASNRVWRIRYIPIHGQQDAYGGEFVLSDRAKLEAFQSGDYVTIEGAIVAAAASTGNTGRPQYAPHQVSRLAP